MDSTVLSRLVDAYVERHAKQFQWDRDLVLREQDTNFWAFEEFDRLVRRQPEDAWEAVLAVLAATTDEYTLSNLAAGPLEDLINQHGEAFIDRIETLARCEPRFQELLCGVWRGSTPEIWHRVVRARETKSRE